MGPNGSGREAAPSSGRRRRGLVPVAAPHQGAADPIIAARARPGHPLEEVEDQVASRPSDCRQPVETGVLAGRSDKRPEIFAEFLQQMRKSLEEQVPLGAVPITEVELDLNCRHELVPILKALQHVYGQPRRTPVGPAQPWRAR